MVGNVGSVCVEAMRRHTVAHPARSLGITVIAAALAIIGIVGACYIGINGRGIGLLAPSSLMLLADLGFIVWIIRTYRAHKRQGEEDTHAIGVPQDREKTRGVTAKESFEAALTETHPILMAAAKFFPLDRLETFTMVDGKFTLTFNFEGKLAGTLHHPRREIPIFVSSTVTGKMRGPSAKDDRGKIIFDSGTLVAKVDFIPFKSEHNVNGFTAKDDSTVILHVQLVPDYPLNQAGIDSTTVTY